MGLNLTGYRKICFQQKKYRIVWQVLAEGKVLISQIWGIGPRDKAESYRLIMKRVQESLSYDK